MPSDPVRVRSRSRRGCRSSLPVPSSAPEAMASSRGMPRLAAGSVRRSAALVDWHDSPAKEPVVSSTPAAKYADQLPATADLVVVGGGIVGAATAFYATRAGLRVVLL